MNLYEIIKNTERFEDIKILIDKIIEYLEKNASSLNDGIKNIGPNLEVNPVSRILKDKDEILKQEFNNHYYGFIPKDVKLIYGILTNIDPLCEYSGGWYYYLDNYDYIYEFAKFIKDKDIKNEYDLVSFVYIFLRSYFDNKINSKDRLDIHSLIYKDNYHFFEPIKEHSNGDFIKNNAAMCTEYASATSNILSVFGIEAIYLQNFRHAYNIFSLQNEDEPDITDYYLLDTTTRMLCYEVDSSNYQEEAYIEYIPNFDEKELVKLFDDKRNIVLPFYYLLHCKNKYFKIYSGKNLVYDVASDYDLYVENFDLRLSRK